MNVWRMAFRHGENGRSDWHKFRKAGIAAIGYPDIEAVDFSKYGEREAKKILKRNVLAPSQKSSLRQFVYEMQKGDTIYVKEGSRIVGKGTIVSDYSFAKAGTNGIRWPHRRHVQWGHFKPRKSVLGSNQRYVVQQLTGDTAGVQGNSDNARVLFARVGQMTYYAGPMKGDERPQGGGEYNADKLGHEAFNFARFNGDSKRLFGFFHATRSDHINLQRVDPSLPKEADKVGNVLVIFVAPYKGGQRIVGWYRNATVHRTRVPFPSEIRRQVQERLQRANAVDPSFRSYTVEAPRANATLLPTSERKKSEPIPGTVKGGFGESNVRYVYDKDGVRTNSPWMSQAVAFVENYAKENLLNDPEAEDVSEEVGAIAEEQAAGFQSNPAIRREIEQYAMRQARKELERRGYANFTNTALYKCYDYTCTKMGTLFYVEVKGTQTQGLSVFLTRNEVEHVQDHPGRSIFVLVHSVRVNAARRINASGGKVMLDESWRLRPKDLKVNQYVWTVG